jgi:hypothetical protein
MKTHLTYRILPPGAAEPVETGAAFCGNNNRGYKYGLKIAFKEAFRKTPAADRCAHCERIYLERRNISRRKKGLQPVTTPFEGQDCN